MNVTPELREVRRLVADLLVFVEWHNCADMESLCVTEAALARLLKVPKYPDGSGFNFYKFRTRKGKARR